MKILIKISLFSLLFFLFPVCVNAAKYDNGDEKTEVITGFECQEPILENYYISYEQKPSKAELVQAFPGQMQVYLNGSDTAVAIDVSWFDITEDYDTSSAYYYQFSPSWDTDTYQLEENIDLYTEVPYVAVFFYSENGVSSAAATNYANETIVYEFLRDNFDMNIAAICGILANLQKESKFDPLAYNGNDTGGTISYGLCQWNSGGGRYYTLQNWCAAKGYDYTTLDAQLRFMEHELRTQSYYRLAQLENNIPNSADGAYEASMLFSRYYEGCSSRYHVERANLAKNTYWPAYCHLTGIHSIFSDVTSGDWYADAVEYVYNRRFMTGMTTSVFGPAESISRAQFVVAMHRTVGAPDAAYINTFADVPDGTWYSDAVMWGHNGCIITGYANGCFGPADSITREQIATILYRYAHGMTYDVSVRSDISGYADAVSVSPFAQIPMEWAVGKGIISGTDGGTRLSPQKNASRAECAMMIMRFCKAYNI